MTEKQDRERASEMGQIKFEGRDIDLTTHEGTLEFLDMLRARVSRMNEAVDAHGGTLQQEDAAIEIGLDTVRVDLAGQREVIRRHVGEIERLVKRCIELEEKGDAALREELDALRSWSRGAVSRSKYVALLAAASSAADINVQLRRDLEAVGRNRDKLAVANAELGSGVAQSILDAQAERDALKEDHARACETIAKMHAAAVGEVTGPRRGVVEDVEDLRLEVERLRSKVQRPWETLREQGFVVRGPEGESRDELTAERDALKERLAAVNRDVGVLSAELDRERLQHAGCLMAAEGSREVDSLERGAYAWSPALDATRQLRRDYDALRGAARGLLANLQDVLCPHALGIRETVAALCGYDGTEPVLRRAESPRDEVVEALAKRVDALEDVVLRRSQPQSQAPLPIRGPIMVPTLEG